LGNSIKKIKSGKLKGPSHKKGGVLIEAEGGEYIIKKSSAKKIGKKALDKINREGKLPMRKPKKKMGGGMIPKKKSYSSYKRGGSVGSSIKTYAKGGYVEGK
tara:strand:+ start:180 stop:485 length:306 start_codon:yes stop_codon:yes gene_type:complete